MIQRTMPELMGIDVLRPFSSAAAFISSQIENERQRSLLHSALISLQNDAAEEPFIPFIHIPLTVCAAIRGEFETAYPLAMTTTLLFLGIDILDDLADGDTREFWKGYKREEINLAAVLLLCSLPQIAIADFKISAKCRNSLYKTLADSFLQMSSGQQKDIEFTKTSLRTVDEIEQSVIKKTGEELALFITLAAHFAGADRKTAEAYTKFGRFLGTAIQFVTDCHDLFEAPFSRDLMHGTRTLPIAFHLERKTGEERDVFLKMLGEAEQDTTFHENVRQKLKDGGDLRCTAFVTELYCQRALNALNTVRLQGAAGDALRGFVNHISFFPKREINKERGAENELRKRGETCGQIAGERLV